MSMPNILQSVTKTVRRARQTLAAQPPLARWLVYGALLLVGILAGGAVTAYGGLLLVLLLWALCTGTLWLLLTAARNAAFPAERGKKDLLFRRCLAVGSVVCILVIAGLVFYRQTV